MAPSTFVKSDKELRADERKPAPPSRVRVSEAMSTELLTARLDELVSAVDERARRRNLHHVIVLHASGDLAGMICGCDMQTSSPEAVVREAMSVCAMFTGPGDSLAVVAETMARYGVGALPVLDLNGRAMGIITRSDLRSKGALPNELGVDRCASCGSSHLLCPRGVNDVCFCRTCRETSDEDDMLGAGD